MSDRVRHMRHLIVPDSDIIESIGFKPIIGNVPGAKGLGTLEVVFKASTDTVYTYERVGFDTFAVLVSAESIGKTFHEMFRKTKYPFTKALRVDLKK